MLCSSCLEKVAETLEISSARKDCIPEPFCLVNAEDLKVYSLQRKDKTKMIDDFYVSIDFKSKSKVYWLFMHLTIKMASSDITKFSRV